MARYTNEAWKGKHIFAGIDLHRKRWHVSLRTQDGLLLFSNRIDGDWESLRRLLDGFSEAAKISAVYEAGYFGFWLYDLLIAYGVDAHVTPPNLIPRASGNRVKTDRLDSQKLAEYLQSGILKDVYVPTSEERGHRAVSRRRRQLIGDRVRAQQRIKADLCSNGIDLPRESKGKWSRVFVERLCAFRFKDRYLQKSFECLLRQFDFVTELIDAQTQQLKALSRTEKYAKRVAILVSTPGIGWLSAMEILLELQTVTRFQRADQLAAYVGLTPSQHSTGEHVWFGRITRQGKAIVRALLVQASWRLIQKDAVMRDKYEQIKKRAGGKRAIVAIARTLLIRLRRILINQEPYALGLIQG